MPEGKRCESARMFPCLSRDTCQQSSMTMYWYPASFIPLVTIASAMDLIMSSLTLQPNLFQLFQPIGGVSATPLSQARVASGNEERKMRTTTDKTIFRLNGNLPMAASEEFRAASYRI